MINEIERVIDGADKTVSHTLKGTGRMLSPLRRSALRRFPTLFILLTTFGVSATVFAFERLLAEWQYIYERPHLILIIGVATLIITGQLYRKLG